MCDCGGVVGGQSEINEKDGCPFQNIQIPTYMSRVQTNLETPYIFFGLNRCGIQIKLLSIYIQSFESFLIREEVTGWPKERTDTRARLN